MSKIKDGRKNNGGHSTKGYAGRKPKSAELKVSGYAEKAIIEKYGSLDKFWGFIAGESRESFPHLQMLMNYYVGKPTENKSIKVDSKQPIIYITYGDEVNNSLPEDIKT